MQCRSVGEDGADEAKVDCKRRGAGGFYPALAATLHETFAGEVAQELVAELPFQARKRCVLDRRNGLPYMVRSSIC